MQEERRRKNLNALVFPNFLKEGGNCGKTQQFAPVYYFNTFHVLLSEAALLVITEQFMCHEYSFPNNRVCITDPHPQLTIWGWWNEASHQLQLDPTWP